MSLINSDQLWLWMILGKRKYKNTYMLVPFAITRASWDANGKITQKLEK